jgi:Flp pilus assembly protein TadD
METKSENSGAGKATAAVLVGMAGLLLGAAALVLVALEKRQSESEVRRLEKRLDEAAEGDLGRRLDQVELHMRSLASNHLTLTESAATEEQFRSMLNDLTYMRANLGPLLDRLDHLGSGTNAPAEIRKQAEEMASLQARLATLSAEPVPYTPEELALLRSDQAPVRTRDLKLMAELSRQGEDAYAAGRHADAEVIYRKLLELNPRDHLTLANLGTVQMELGKLDDAERNLLGALELHANDAKTVSLIGLVKLRQQKLDDALGYLGRAAAMNPKDAEAHNYLGVVLSQKGQRTAAEAAFRMALKIAPEYGVAHFNMAVYYITANPPSVSLARYHYDRAVKAGHPKHAQVEKMLGVK